MAARKTMTKPAPHRVQVDIRDGRQTIVSEAVFEQLAP